MFERYQKLAEQALRDEAPSMEDARWILEGEDLELPALLQTAFVPRKKYFGKKVMVQVLNNVQNGACPEDCGYCSQSKNSEAAIRNYKMKTEEEILTEAEAAARAGANRYCLVLSGRGPNLERTRELASIIRKVKETYPVEVCLSAGLIDLEKARILADSGLDRLNHNLNTSEARYEKICTTHSYADRVTTLMIAKSCGLESCSGFILGMGETSDEILEIAMRLRELEVPSIPVNFLIPIEGNTIVSDSSLTPEHCLRVLCLFRLFNPRAEIRAAAGREGHLRSMEALALWPANSLFVDGYLTTRGEAREKTFRMIHDAGFEILGNELYDDLQLKPTNEFQIPGGGEELLKPEATRKRVVPETSASS